MPDEGPEVTALAKYHRRRSCVEPFCFRVNAGRGAARETYPEGEYSLWADWMAERNGPAGKPDKAKY